MHSFTFACILKACGSVGVAGKRKACMRACGNLGEANKGQHVRVVMEEFLEGNDIPSRALVNMYVKCGMLCEAKDIVNKLQIWDIVEWNSLIVGYIQCKLT